MCFYNMTLSFASLLRSRFAHLFSFKKYIPLCL